MVPAHKVVLPVIEAGSATTVATTVVKQPVPSVYVIREVPADIPVIIAEVDPISATEVLALLQVPPPPPVRVDVAFTHTERFPVGVDGVGLTVSMAVVVATPQPLVIV